jgi:hypothetical protein
MDEISLFCQLTVSQVVTLSKYQNDVATIELLAARIPTNCLLITYNWVPGT